MPVTGVQTCALPIYFKLGAFLDGAKSVETALQAAHIGKAKSAQIENGASDQQMAEWLDQTGEKKTAEEVKRWSDEVEATRPYDDPERRDWFIEQTKPVGLDASKVTLFDWLEVDDTACHASAA